jgi:hypothetical protein
MGILSWFRSRRSADALDDADTLDDGPPNLIKYRYEDPAFESVERAAARDVAAVEEDAKYFGRDSPADEDEL